MKRKVCEIECSGVKTFLNSLFYFFLKNSPNDYDQGDLLRGTDELHTLEEMFI